MERARTVASTQKEKQTEPTFIPSELKDEIEFLLKIEGEIRRATSIFIRRLPRLSLLDHFAIVFLPDPNKRMGLDHQKFAEDLFETSLAQCVKNAKPEWSEQQRAIYVRWAGATAIEVLMQATPQTTDQSVVDSINLTARRIVFQSAQKSQRHGATIDPDWQRNLATEVLSCMPLERDRLRNYLQVFINFRGH